MSGAAHSDGGKGLNHVPSFNFEEVGRTLGSRNADGWAWAHPGHAITTVGTNDCLLTLRRTVSSPVPSKLQIGAVKVSMRIREMDL
jgi:hypothetical protein